MDAQVHVLCSNCEKVMVELQKDKRNKEDSVINIEKETIVEEKPSDEKIEVTIDNTIDEEKEPSLNFKSISPDEEESSFCEIKIDYSKKERARSHSRAAEDMILTDETLETVGFGDATMKKFEPTIDKIRMIAG